MLKRVRNTNKQRQLFGRSMDRQLFKPYAEPAYNANMRKRRNADKNVYGELRRRYVRSMGSVQRAELYGHKTCNKPSLRNLRNTNQNGNLRQRNG
jgi:hypothetical protein